MLVGKEECSKYDSSVFSKALIYFLLLSWLAVIQALGKCSLKVKVKVKGKGTVKSCPNY